MAVRTFLALDLDESILAALGEVRSRLDDRQAKMRWVAAANMHLTMQFLGDVDEGIIPAVCGAAEAAAASVQPFDFEVKGVVCVPPAGRLRMIWASVIDTSGGLAGLHEALAGELAGAGFQPEGRPFRPHLTLARIKQIRSPATIRQAAAAYKDADFGCQHVGELVTYSSQLTPDGPIYTPLSRSPLGE